MCYVVELMDKYISSQTMTVTVKKNEGIKMDYVKWEMTSDYDYLGAALGLLWVDVRPLEFTSLFGESIKNKITTLQTIRNPLKCKKHNPDYISEQQCLVNNFFDKDFSPCPAKCIPIQMRGFRYINSSFDLENCSNLDDEICIGGPSVWKELQERFEKCMKPCSVSSYDYSVIKIKELTYITDEKNEATFEFFNSEVIQVEKEVLLYDLSDLIGTIGGSCGIGVGISVFAVISCCIDSFSKLLNILQRKKEKNIPLVQECQLSICQQ